jgi:leader peptidase (prepilin peptidase)/N-methyltransferase
MSALLVLAVIDWRSYEIPISINIFILCLGILQVFLDRKNWMDYAAGFLCVSMFLFLLLVVSKGRAIGGGDVKLMAAAGLLLGWKNIILAFLLGCIIGSVIHLLRMKLSGADHVLAMGPYLSVGIAVAALWGDTLINWYISLL